jgi:hypothetical protein
MVADLMTKIMSGATYNRLATRFYYLGVHALQIIFLLDFTSFLSCMHSFSSRGRKYREDVDFADIVYDDGS